MKSNQSHVVAPLIGFAGALATLVTMGLAVVAPATLSPPMAA